LGALELTRKPRRGDVMTVELDALSLRGLGLRRVTWQPQPQGLRVFARREMELEVRLALPGERVRIEVMHVEKHRAEARVLDFERRSALRRSPRCKHFEPAEGRGCGGCSLQSVLYEDQLGLKRETLRQALASRGLEIPLEALLSARHEWNYRNKMEYSFGHTLDGRPGLGLHPVGSRNRVIELEECYLQSAFSAALVVAIRDWMRALAIEPYHHRRNTGFGRTLTVREGKQTGERLVLLTSASQPMVQTSEGMWEAQRVAESFTQRVLSLATELGERVDGICWRQQILQTGVATRFETCCLWGSPVLHERLELSDGSALRFEVGPASFFQTNTLHAQVLYSTVIQCVTQGQARVGRVFDLYCGTGSIGLCLARHAERVIGIELDREAVRSAQANAEYNGIENVTFLCGDVGRVLREQGERASGVGDVVVVDPPRSGLGRVALEQVIALGAPRLIYVSCNPFSMAKELSVLQERYELEKVRGVDMFPQTGHVEAVASLRLRAVDGERESIPQ
jgi:23S rRNA (uracil1939-C5)-methyltransferase